MVPPVTDPTQPSATPAFLNHDRPPVPDLVVPRGVQPFHLDQRPVRGRVVKLGPLADALLGRHAQHPAVLRLMGEALALTAALATALKFKGSFSLQAKGDGPIAMLLADCTDSGGLRGYAKADPERLEALLAEHPQPSAAQLLGQGYFAFTCDQGDDMERYQGIVAIEGETLAEMTDTYFRTSEQLQTEVRLACGRTLAGWRASALVIERVASEGGIGAETQEDQEDAWRTAQALVGTLKTEEMLDDALPAERLLHRLFHAEGLLADRPRALSYGCRCSRARLAAVLETFGPEDLDHMAESGAITMTCEFCAVDFRFERAEVDGKAGRA
ncbi:Hsp33 family molecular chaperone HslO [Falsiroseomonas sp.]|uniref:Hsp33 family molecular chaperone HslO n=1 Tax=Falsiroseomonas sp. TaxID=2870721 RepID=UPI003F72D304